MPLLCGAWLLLSPQVRIVRIFNTYGPRMALDDGRVVSNFVSQALTDQPITIYGDGKQVGAGALYERGMQLLHCGQPDTQVNAARL